MKTYVTYGLILTFVSAVVTLVLQIMGMFTPEHLGTAMILGILCGLALNITLIIMGTKADRATVGAAAFGYGRALKAGFMIVLFAACFGLVFNLIYFKFINPNMGETTAEWTRSLMERMGAPDAQIEAKIAEIKEKSTLMRQVVNGFISTIVFGTIVSLITSAFLKRPAAEPPLKSV